MSGRHAAGAHRRSRREVIDDHDAETIALFARINRPARVARQFVCLAVAGAVSDSVGAKLQIKAALRMTEAIRRYAQAGAR